MRTTEVTQCQYLACVKARRCAPPDAARMWPGDDAMIPVTGVTHAQAEAYCRFEGGRLPGEAEWIRGVQGSGSGAQAPGDAAPLGIRRLGGPSLEWTGDWFARWPVDPAAAARGPERGESRVVRGLVPEQRDRRAPGYRGRDLGFRCVRPAANP